MEIQSTSPALSTNKGVVFRNPHESTLKKILHRKVDEYFTRTGTPKTGTPELYSKTVILLTVLVLTYVGIIVSQSMTLSLLVLYPLLGLTFASIGFNVMHDSAHGSYSSKKWVNELFGYSLNLVGGNVLFWKQKHNIAHHTYTNINNHDEDIDIPGMRVHSVQPWKWYHKYQHVYWVLFYAFTYILWIFVSDFAKYFSGKVRVAHGGKIIMKPIDHVIFWVSKIAYICIFIGIPWYSHGFAYALSGFLVLSLVCGFVISTIFQLAHIVEDTDNVTSDNGVVHDDWTAHQLKTTADFATKSKVLSWIVGGLNFQVEHHLFPKISHVHYPKIMGIVQNVALAHGIRHNEESTLWSAIMSHVKVLKKLGQQPSVA